MIRRKREIVREIHQGVGKNPSPQEPPTYHRPSQTCGEEHRKTVQEHIPRQVSTAHSPSLHKIPGEQRRVSAEGPQVFARDDGHRNPSAFTKENK